MAWADRPPFLGHGSGVHAPNEYYVIDSSNPKIQGIDGAVRSGERAATEILDLAEAFA